jgi:hypothetical protein
MFEKRMGSFVNVSPGEEGNAVSPEIIGEFGFAILDPDEIRMHFWEVLNYQPGVTVRLVSHGGKYKNVIGEEPENCCVLLETESFNVTDEYKEIVFADDSWFINGAKVDCIELRKYVIDLLMQKVENNLIGE